ncbi:MAG TPA: hypothetical protein VJP77_07825 [Planctomycetota bacterium]|nr:hypothetical protein [Planctomycetota bacterium]
MKRKILYGALVWACLISLVHLQLNVGWDELGRRVRVLLGYQRDLLLVGFLPVT